MKSINKILDYSKETVLILIKLQAAKNFKIAADKVSTEAMFNYGLLLLNSYGFEIDKKTQLDIIEWLKIKVMCR